MNELAKYEEYERKLAALCAENNLIFVLERDKYPMTLTIKPNENAQQPFLFNLPENTYSNPQAYVCLVYIDDEITYRFSKNFIISDALLGKIKGLFKKLYFYWLQAVFRTVQERQLLNNISQAESK